VALKRAVYYKVKFALGIVIYTQLPYETFYLNESYMIVKRYDETIFKSRKSCILTVESF